MCEPALVDLMIVAACLVVFTTVGYVMGRRRPPGPPGPGYVICVPVRPRPTLQVSAAERA